MQSLIRVLNSISLWVIGAKKPDPSHHSIFHLDRRKDLNRLFQEISRSIRFLAGPARSGGLFLVREKHEELGRQLSELQRRMSRLDEKNRQKYEARAQSLMADAAKVGITLPPP